MVYTRGFERFVNLSDAVIAIAATLLILPLVDVAKDIGTEDPGVFLAHNGEQLFLFVLSFAVISRFWLIHHQLYRNVIGYTIPLAWLNFLWLLSIVFLPFPTELLGQVTDGATNPVTVTVYIGTLLITSASGTAQQYVIIKTPALQLASVRGTFVLWPSLVATLALAVALIASLLIPGLGLWSILILSVTGWVEAAIARRRRVSTDGHGHEVAKSPSDGSESP